jgi:hypothetical protein
LHNRPLNVDVSPVLGCKAAGPAKFKFARVQDIDAPVPAPDIGADSMGIPSEVEDVR